MNDTIRYNLDLRERLKRKPTKKFHKTKKLRIQDTQSLSEAERKELLFRLINEEKNENTNKLIALFVSLALTSIIFLAGWWILT